MCQQLFPVKTGSFVDLPVLWENRNVVLPFISAFNVISNFVAEVCCWGRERKIAGFLPFLNKANSTVVAKSPEIAKI